MSCALPARRGTTGESRAGTADPGWPKIFHAKEQHVLQLNCTHKTLREGLEGSPSTSTGQGNGQEPVLQAGNRRSYSWGALHSPSGQESNVHPSNAEFFPV